MARTAGLSAVFGASLGLAALIALIVTPARSEDYPACAKIDNPLAYNRCLAAHGPAAPGTRAIPIPPDADKLPNARSSAMGHNRFGSAMRVSRTRHGRMVLEFSVDAASSAHLARRRGTR
jgi:hypothetical protein